MSSFSLKKVAGLLFYLLFFGTLVHSVAFC